MRCSINATLLMDQSCVWTNQVLIFCLFSLRKLFTVKKTICEMKYRCRSLSDGSVKQSCVEAAALLLETWQQGGRNIEGERDLWSWDEDVYCINNVCISKGVASQGRSGEQWRLRLARRELVDEQFGPEEVVEDASVQVTMGSWQGHGQMTQGAMLDEVSKGRQLSVGWC